jgi:hypothetical protein
MFKYKNALKINIMNNLTFDDLFALRFQYQDYTMDEYSIIHNLKLNLLNSNMELHLIDEYLFNFYISFDYPITFEEIKLIKISVVNTEVEESIDEESIDEESIDEESIDEELDNDISDVSNNDIINSINNINNVNNIIYLDHNSLITLNSFNNIMSLINTIINEHINVNTSSDVVVTTDDDFLDKINNIVIEETLADKCSICIGLIEKDDIILDIECKHYFHKECLLEYLKKYNHICPICRKEIGQSKINY